MAIGKLGARGGTGSLGVLGGVGIPPPPAGYIYIIDTDGAYIIDTDGAYLVELA